MYMIAQGLGSFSFPESLNLSLFFKIEIHARQTLFPFNSRGLENGRSILSMNIDAGCRAYAQVASKGRKHGMNAK